MGREGGARRQVFPEGRDGQLCPLLLSDQDTQLTIRYGKMEPPWQEQFQWSGGEENPTRMGEERMVCEERKTMGRDNYSNEQSY